MVEPRPQPTRLRPRAKTLNGRAAAAAGLPVTVTTLERALMRRLGGS